MSDIDITESEKGFLTVSTKDYFKGELILSIEGTETLVRDKYTIQISPNLHISPNDDSGKYINHSCFPNTQVNSNREFIALKMCIQ